MIPGLCSASMSITLGIYEDIIELFSSFYKPKILKKHFMLAIGIIIGLILCVLIFSKLFGKYKLYLSSIFIGFILGDYIKSKKIKEVKKNNIIYFLIGIAVVIFTTLIGNIQLINNVGTNSLFFEYLLLSLISIFSSLALILPGISGSMILYIFGVYEKVSKSIESIIYNIFNFQPLLGQEFLYLLIFLLTFILGILVFSKIVDKFLKNNNIKFLTLINGFVIGSIIVLMFDVVVSITSFYNILISILLISIGTFISNLLKRSNE